MPIPRKCSALALAAALLSSAACQAQTPSQAPAQAASQQPAPAPFSVPPVSQIKFGPHPRVALSPDEAKALRAAPDFEAKKAAAAKSADKLLADPPELPDGFGSWTFYYANPETGNDLVPINAKAHKDPKTGQIFTDERTVAAYRGRQHYALEKAAESLAWAYFYTNDDKYALGVIRILSFLAQQYPTYPERLDRWGRTGWLAPLGGRRYVQTLDEAVGVIALARAYDLTYNSPAWTPALRKNVEEEFFLGTAKSLSWFKQPHNHQTWYNAGLVAIACALGDAKMLHNTLTMDKGVVEQLGRNVGSDGLWAEGTMAYHSYALQAILKTADITKRNGIDISTIPQLKLLIKGPIYAAYPDGSLPAINDSDPGSIAGFDYAFKWAYQTYKEPFFAQADAQGDPKALAALLGPDATPESKRVQWPLDLPSTNLADNGLAILRIGSGKNANCLFIDYGKHGIAHGHYDKLNITLFANGREWILDPGRLTYSHKEYTTWVKETVAHNTVVIDGRSQAATEGKLLYLKSSPDKSAPNAWTALRAQCDTAYVGVKLDRTLVLTPDFLLDVYDVSADSPRHIDYVLHTRSEKIDPPDFNSLSPIDVKEGPQDNGYQHLTSRQYFAADKVPSTWVFTQGALKLKALFLAPPASETIMTCNGIGYHTSEMTPSLLRRRSNTDKTRFTTVLDLTGTGQGVTSAKATTENTFEITTPKNTWTITLTPEGPQITAK
jgi:oligo-alginate lyase